MRIKCPRCGKLSEVTGQPARGHVCPACGARIALARGRSTSSMSGGTVASAPPQGSGEPDRSAVETLDHDAPTLPPRGRTGGDSVGVSSNEPEPATVDGAAATPRPATTDRSGAGANEPCDSAVERVLDALHGRGPSPAVPSDATRTFGNHELLLEIARGGMGVVYKARQRSLNRIVALKMILAGQLASDADVRRFRAEAEAAANLQHPNIVAIHEVGEHNGHHYFSMDYVEGTSLAAMVRDNPLAGPRAAQYVRAIAEAIQYAHERGILHRDLKPSNVLVDRTDQPRVTDFGLAKRIEGGSELTASGAIVGTPSYMPPEQAGGERDRVGPASDVYSLGAILYELVTGRPPFRAETPLDTVLQVLQSEPVAPRLLNPKIHRDLETVCLKCLQKEPHKRYGSARELADDLERFVNHEPIKARPVRLPGRVWRWCRRKPALAGASALAVLALVAAAGLSVSFAIYQARAARRLGREQSETVRVLAESYLERGRILCEQGNLDQGMLWLARSLETAPADAVDLQRIIRFNLGDARQQIPFPLRVALAQEGVVVTALFTHDGSRIISTGGTGWHHHRLWFWDASNGRPVRSEASLANMYGALALSPDSRTAVTGDAGGVVQLWDLETGRAIGPRLQHGSVVRVVAYSHDGKTILSGGDDSTARLWDAATQQPQQPPLHHGGQVHSAAFAPDGQTVATGGYNGTARLWNVATRQPVGTPLQHSNWVNHVAFAPDGQRVATASSDATARVWDAVSGQAISAPMTHQGAVLVLAFSPDGTLLLTGSTDGTARLWDAATGQSKGSPLQHQGFVRQVAFSPDGRLLATASTDRTARVWDAITLQPIGAPLQHVHEVWTLSFSPDGTRLLTADFMQTIRLWDLTSFDRAGLPLEHPSAVVGVRFASDDSRILTTCADNTVHVWDAARRKPIGPTLDRHAAVWTNQVGANCFCTFCTKTAHLQPPVRAVAISPDGKVVLTGRADGTAQRWDAATLQPIGPPLRDDGPVAAVAFSPDGSCIATGSRSKTCRIWEAATGEPIGAPLVQPGTVHDVLFSPGGKTLLSVTDLQFSRLTVGGQQGDIARGAQLWDVPTGQAVGRPIPIGGDALFAAFSPDGRIVVVAGTDHSARICKVATGESVGVVRHQGSIPTIAFSPDGTQLLTGSSDQTARLWDAVTFQPIGLPLQHQGAVQAVSFSPDGTIIVTASSDNTARLWDAATQKPISSPMVHRAAVRAVAFSPDGKRIVSASDDRLVRIRSVPISVEADAERVKLWTEVITGQALHEDGMVRPLDGDDWRNRRQRLDELGGPPYPDDTESLAAQAVTWRREQEDRRNDPKVQRRTVRRN